MFENEFIQAYNRFSVIQSPLDIVDRRRHQTVHSKCYTLEMRLPLSSMCGDSIKQNEQRKISTNVWRANANQVLYRFALPYKLHIAFNCAIIHTAM